MGPGPVFSRAFFAGPTLEVARGLVGAYVVLRRGRGPRLVGRVVEVEAYLGESDPASHAFRGPTPRNGVMFGPPGRLYVYRSYGIHLCANAVCEPDGTAGAVLLRAIEPAEGAAQMRSHRGLAPDAPAHDVGSGPGKLGQALALSLDDYGASLLRGAITLRRPGADDPPPRLVATPRIGLSQAVDLPYRFLDADSACVSRASPGSPSRGRRRGARRSARATRPRGASPSGRAP